jgi:long-chain acyl-CoA synthetase
MNPVWLTQYDPQVPPTLTYPDWTMPELLSRSAARFADRPALRYYGRTLDYRELDEWANGFASLLRRLGVRSGEVVGLMLPNVPQTVIGYFGALRAGAVVTMINPLYLEGEIGQQVMDSGCATVVALPQFLPRLSPLLGRTCLKRVLIAGAEDFLPWLKRRLYPFVKGRAESASSVPYGPSVLSLKRLLSREPATPAASLKAEDLALLQYTGGTTGVPKGVMLTHRNLLANVWQCRQWAAPCRLEEGREVCVGVLPFFHVYGMSICQNFSISIGSALVLLPRFQLTEVLDAIVRERVTLFPGIPAMYQAIGNNQTVNLRSLKLCVSGAGPLPPPVQERFERMTGACLVEGYGLTEAAPVTHVNVIGSEPSKRRPGSIGLPLPGTDAKIVDVDTGADEVPVGEVGELVVRGPQVMRGYWRQEEDTRRTLREGWLYTGDLARMETDGYFYIMDRKKDMIKSGGENVYPREVEEALLRHPKVHDAVVVGLPQGLRGEVIKAYVVLKAGEAATTGELLDHCRTHLARFKVPKLVEFRRELPKNLVGKVLRRVLIEEERRARAADTHTP